METQGQDWNWKIKWGGKAGMSKGETTNTKGHLRGHMEIVCSRKFLNYFNIYKIYERNL